MTLPASYPISMLQVATELGLSLPLSINHGWVLALANKSGFPVSLGDLLGKTGRFDGNRTGQTSGSDVFINLNNAPFFGGTLAALDTSFPDGNHCQMSIGSPPIYSGNIFFKNNTTGVSVTLSKTTYLGNVVWQAGVNPANLVRNGVTDSYTILPSN